MTKRYAIDPIYRESRIAASAKYRQANPDKIRAYNAARLKDADYAGKILIRNTISGALKTRTTECGPKRDEARFKDLVGCSFDGFRLYIEQQFPRGCDWEDYAVKWSTRFRVPLKSFNCATPKGRKLAAHYTNIRVVRIELV